jgi:hypothetical protein
MSITGHTDIREIERYCREAARKKVTVAAMTKLEGIRLLIARRVRQ